MLTSCHKASCSDFAEIRGKLMDSARRGMGERLLTARRDYTCARIESPGDTWMGSPADHCLATA